jgi:hypothetical protein
MLPRNFPSSEFINMLYNMEIAALENMFELSLSRTSGNREKTTVSLMEQCSVAKILHYRLSNGEVSTGSINYLSLIEEKRDYFLDDECAPYLLEILDKHKETKLRTL